MDIAKLTNAILDENLALLANADAERVVRFVQDLQEAKRVFCSAQGRSGNVLRCFCMRLMHLGYEAYVVGETVTPPIGLGDVAVVVSGTGATRLTVETARMAREHGAKTCGIVGVKGSALEKELDTVLILPGGSRLDGVGGAGASVQPSGSLFEQAAFLLLEAIVLALYQRQGSDRNRLLDRHANLE